MHSSKSLLTDQKRCINKTGGNPQKPHLFELHSACAAQLVRTKVHSECSGSKQFVSRTGTKRELVQHKYWPDDPLPCWTKTSGKKKTLPPVVTTRVVVCVGRTLACSNLRGHKLAWAHHASTSTTAHRSASLAKVLRRAACFACCIVAATRMPTAASTARVTLYTSSTTPRPRPWQQVLYQRNHR